MRFADIDINIPQELISSLSSDRLVIFVGAGVSARAYPLQPVNTYYPLFKELIEQIGKEQEIYLTDEDETKLNQGLFDRILGEWKKNHNCDVHKAASDILQRNEDGIRIDFHKSILSLFPDNSNPKIVTTNFDNLLIRTRNLLNLDKGTWKIFEAPSLPPASRFKGICFLHGKVDHPGEMILTDEDIGRAYMGERWALKFANDLFRMFNVLFIGYSLEDPPLRYLSLALEGTTDSKEKWSFVPRPKEESKMNELEKEWLRRGVEVIWYPLKRNDYRSLEKVLGAWANDNSLSYVDRRNFLADMAKSSPKLLLPHSLDRLKLFTDNTALLRDFAKNTLHQDWFDTLFEWKKLPFLFSNSYWLTPEDHNIITNLINWLFSEPTKWILKIEKYRKSIHPGVFQIFCQMYDKNDKLVLSPKDLRLILELFRFVIENDKSKEYAYFLEKILKLLVDNGFYDDAIWLFSSIIEINIRIKEQFNLDFIDAQVEDKDNNEKRKPEIEFVPEFSNQMEDTLWRSYLKKVFFPKVSFVGELLLKELSKQFLNMLNALKRAGEGHYSIGNRRAIEPNEADKYGNPVINFYFDILRDLWEGLLHAEPIKAHNIYELWSELNERYFERLSLHALRKMLESGYVKQ